MRPLVIGMIFLVLTSSAIAGLVDSVSTSIGYGSPNTVIGGRVALQKDWGDKWSLRGEEFALVGYWDVSAAYWSTANPPRGTNDSLGAFAIAPIFRLEALKPLGKSHLYPYFEVSVGGSYLTNDKMGRRDYGSRFNFQDLMGGGLRIGKNKQIDVSLHYLHYSNANMFPPNHGLDVAPLFSMRYHFDAGKVD